MPEHILIASLGLSPGAVSGVAFGLRRGISVNGKTVKFPISRVITLGTSNPKVLAAAGYLDPLFEEAGIQFESNYIPQPELKQTNNSVGTFIARMGALLETAQAGGNIVHTAITGGRSGMGAMAALATSLYGANHLWHLWVSAETELKGRIGDLPQPFNMSNIYLNPPPENYELVELPFLDMRPLHPQLWDYYHSGQWPKNSEWNRILKTFSTDGVQLGNLFPAAATTNHKQHITDIVQRYSQVESNKENLQKDALNILRQAGLVDNTQANKLQKAMMLDQGPADVLKIAEQQPALNDFWLYLRSRETWIYAVINSGKRPVSQPHILRNLATTFNKEELRTFCYDMNVPYDDLPGEGNSAIARELIAYMQRRGRLPELIASAAIQRPNVAWYEDGDGNVDFEPVTETDMFLLYGLQLWLNFRRYALDN